MLRTAGAEEILPIYISVGKRPSGGLIFASCRLMPGMPEKGKKAKNIPHAAEKDLFAFYSGKQKKRQ